MKADDCDINPELMESSWLKWSADVDLNDCALETEYSVYMEHLTYVEGITVDAQQLEYIEKT